MCIFLSSEIFKLFSRWNQCFRKVLHFLNFWLKSWGYDCYDFLPAIGSPASVGDHVMTGKVYIKLNMSGLDFLLLVLQSSNSFDMNAFFQVLISLLFPGYKGHIQLLCLGAVCSTGCFWKVENFASVLFFVWNLQNVFPLKPMFSKGPSFFYSCSWS